MILLQSCLFDTRLTAVKQMNDILVVDDDRLILELVKQILEQEGIVAHCVASGEEALEQIRDRTFSLMITDYTMPGLNGLELARRGLKLAPHMPIIMDNGGISPQITTLAKEIGISKVLAKPFLPSELINTIRDVMGSQGARPQQVHKRQVSERRVERAFTIYPTASSGSGSEHIATTTD
jgi:DNA-binding response OmpR family regulator